jgi:hypothetical protein
MVDLQANIIDPNCQTDSYGLFLYREAVTSQSPGLLQPWVTVVLAFNPERVAPVDTTTLRLDHKDRLTVLVLGGH